MNKAVVVLLAALFVNVVDFARAQSEPNIPRIGYLTFAGPGLDDAFEVFRTAMHGLGYIDGKNVVFERRSADFKAERLPALAAELVGLKVAVIVTSNSHVAVAAKRATQSIPIVMGSSTDPVGAGLVTSLSKPGGNVTGFASFSGKLGQKRLELLKEINPGNSAVAVVGATPTDIGGQLQIKDLEDAAKSLSLRLIQVPGEKLEDYEPAFAEVSRSGAGAIIVRSGMFGTYSPSGRARVVDLAARTGLPTMYADSRMVEAGGLISYAATAREGFRRAAHYVDRILKGAKPADLPVETPSKFELIINLKAAKQIGLTIPSSVLNRADRIIADK